MKPIIIADKVGKEFSRGPIRGNWRSLFSISRTSSAPETLWALRDVSFEVFPGEMLGIVGANGAGKSTVLRLLGGVGRPTTGSMRTYGRIGALLELAGGFQGDLSGRENAVLGAVVAGLLKREAIERLPEIIRFAELEGFIDSPVRTYSTGMAMRLAFSVAVHTDPDIMLVDEFLSVGDIAFQAKCTDRISALREDGCAIVFVSHGMDQVRKLCDRALWLRRGVVMACDTAKAVAASYEQEMHAETLRRTPGFSPQLTSGGNELRLGENRFGSLEMEVTRAILRPAGMLAAGTPLEVEIQYHADHTMISPVFVVSISRPDGTVCLDVNTEVARVVIDAVKGAGGLRLVIDRVDLVPGDYFVDVGVFSSDWSHAYDYHWHVYRLTVTGGGRNKGILAPPCHWLQANPTSRQVS
jgi:lipopolysaccharide transport system ATP-binding protein